MKSAINDEKFQFGKNWQKFLHKSFSNESLLASKNKLSHFIGPNSLSGKTFVDFGCGSGIHSLAALELGASKIVSVDVDKESVECTKNLRSIYSRNQDWQIYEGSLLDLDFLSSLGYFDIVYCWGVAHHTGDMWKALDNIAKSVKSGGLIFVAIYNYVEGWLGSKMWHKIKKTYNEMPLVIKKIMEYSYIGYNFVIILLHFKNPLRVIKEYKNKRGMAWATDSVDWLGGYPYEYASVEEIFDFYSQRGFELKNIKTTNYIGCNQFLFIKK